MERGTVAWFRNERGFGFIKRSGKPDLFVHYSAIQEDGYKSLKEGDSVSFEVATGAKGLQAEHVVKIKKEKVNDESQTVHGTPG